MEIQSLLGNVVLTGNQLTILELLSLYTGVEHSGKRWWVVNGGTKCLTVREEATGK